MPVINLHTRHIPGYRAMPAAPRVITDRQARDLAAGLIAGAIASSHAAGTFLQAAADFDLHHRAALQLMACLAEHGLHVVHLPAQVPVNSVEAQLVLIEALADLRHAIKRQASAPEIASQRLAHHAALTAYIAATRREFAE